MDNKISLNCASANKGKSNSSTSNETVEEIIQGAIWDRKCATFNSNSIIELVSQNKTFINKKK